MLTVVRMQYSFHTTCTIQINVKMQTKSDLINIGSACHRVITECPFTFALPLTNRRKTSE